MKKAKFNCRHCNKKYPDMLGAVGCSCKKTIEWNNPPVDRKRIVPKKWKITKKIKGSHNPDSKHTTSKQ